jgi:hypothetical protein
VQSKRQHDLRPYEMEDGAPPVMNEMLGDLIEEIDGSEGQKRLCKAAKAHELERWQTYAERLARWEKGFERAIRARTGSPPKPKESASMPPPNTKQAVRELSRVSQSAQPRAPSTEREPSIPRSESGGGRSVYGGRHSRSSHGGQLGRGNSMGSRGRGALLRMQGRPSASSSGKGVQHRLMP